MSSMCRILAESEVLFSLAYMLGRGISENRWLVTYRGTL